jgi:hypothetical protein
MEPTEYADVDWRLQHVSMSFGRALLPWCLCACMAVQGCASHDQNAVEGSDSVAVAAFDDAPAPYRFLMRQAHVVGLSCSYAGAVPEEWEALHELVDARHEALLRDLWKNAVTPEGRLLGLVGLYKIGALKRTDASAAMKAMNALIWVCGGCMSSQEPSGELTSFLDAPPPDQAGTYGIIPEGLNQPIELPGQVRESDVEQAPAELQAP